MAAIIVHGGAYAISDEHVLRKTAGCKNAVSRGYEILTKGGTALDAVEAAVRVLEDDPSFNAGCGSALNKDGDIEMDAMIMDGKDLRLGAVGGVMGVANPVSLARLVMDQTEHTMLIGGGAKALAEEHNVPHVSTEQLMDPVMQKKQQNFQQYNKVVGATFNRDHTHSDKDHTHPDEPTGHDTVGAVAMDTHGNIACATSTGGITLKRPGRVGDSPIIGCGGLADSTLGGVSTTGHGESITRVTLASRVLTLMERGIAVDEAIRQSLQFMYTKTSGRGGLILITREGQPAKGFTTNRMAWASIDREGILEMGMNEPLVNV